MAARPVNEFTTPSPIPLASMHEELEAFKACQLREMHICLRTFETVRAAQGQPFLQKQIIIEAIPLTLSAHERLEATKRSWPENFVNNPDVSRVLSEQEHLQSLLFYLRRTINDLVIQDSPQLPTALKVFIDVLKNTFPQERNSLPTLRNVDGILNALIREEGKNIEQLRQQPAMDFADHVLD